MGKHLCQGENHRIGFSWGNRAIWEDCLIEYNMTRYNDLTSGETIATKTSMIRGIAEENARCRVVLEFMSSINTGRTQTFEDMKMVI